MFFPSQYSSVMRTREQTSQNECAVAARCGKWSLAWDLVRVSISLGYSNYLWEPCLSFHRQEWRRGITGKSFKKPVAKVEIEFCEFQQSPPPPPPPHTQHTYAYFIIIMVSIVLLIQEGVHKCWILSVTFSRRFASVDMVLHSENPRKNFSLSSSVRLL